MQGGFREFAVRAVNSQKAEMDGLVGEALARQSASTEEGRAALAQRGAQLQGDLGRFGGRDRDLSGQLVTSQAELRARLAALEAAAPAGRASGAGGSAIVGGAGGGVIDAATEGCMRQQLDALRQSSHKPVPV